MRTSSPPERPVDLLDLVGRPFVARVGADHDPVRVQEVVDRGALLEELRAGDVGELRSVAADRAAGAGRAPCSSSPGRDRRRRGAGTAPPGPGTGRRRRNRSGGVSTQQNSSRAPSSTSAISVVNRRRSRLRSRSSSMPGSWIGTSPPARGRRPWPRRCPSRSRRGRARRSRRPSPGPPSPLRSRRWIAVRSSQLRQ